MNELHRTTEFVMSEVQAPPDTLVLFVKLSDDYLSLARLEDIQKLEQQLAEAKERDEQCIAHHAGHHQQEERLHAKIARQEEELRILAAQRQDYKAQAAEARALLEDTLEVTSEARLFVYGRIPLTDKIRAFLQKLSD